ncbi:hypothetical protein EBQ81_00865 [bacterium]|nr:hypothetical protein [bacterium]
MSEAQKIKTWHYMAPSHWASYLINDDASGLSDDEQAMADKWFEWLWNSFKGARFIDIADVEDEEFSWNYRSCADPTNSFKGVPSGGSLARYTVLVHY